MASSTPKRHLVRRKVWWERWRVGAHLRWYHGFGNPLFEFEFRIGKPKRVEQPEWIVLEDDLAL